MGQDYATARFNQLIWPLRADVLRVAYFLSHDYSTAEDLSQEVLLKAFKAIETINAGSNGPCQAVIARVSSTSAASMAIRLYSWASTQSLMKLARPFARKFRRNATSS